MVRKPHHKFIAYMESESEIEELIRTIGLNIIRIRKLNDLSQIELAARLNIEDSALRRIEKGKTNPTIRTLYRIASELGVEVTELLS